MHNNSALYFVCKWNTILNWNGHFLFTSDLDIQLELVFVFVAKTNDCVCCGFSFLTQYNDNLKFSWQHFQIFYFYFLFSFHLPASFGKSKNQKTSEIFRPRPAKKVEGKEKKNYSAVTLLYYSSTYVFRLNFHDLRHFWIEDSLYLLF